MYPHRIRLRGPWDCTPLARFGPGELPPPLKVTMPCRWGDAGLAGFAGRVRFVRRFGYPGRIDPFERIWLTFAGVDETAEVSLNGQVLGTIIGGGEFEVTSVLRMRNELVVEVTASGDQGGLWGDVALEVRRTAFLQGITVGQSRGADGTRWEVRGNVAGTAERPLEVYAIHGRFNVGYGVVKAGESFVLTTDPVEDRPGETLRIELVDVGVVWYALDLMLPAE